MSNKMESLLKLLTGYYGWIDTKNKIVLKVYKNDELFMENASYIDFINYFEKGEHIDPLSYDRTMILEWLTRYLNDRSVGISFKTIDKKTKEFVIRFQDNTEDGYKYFYATPTESFSNSFQLQDSLTHLYLRNGIETMIKNEINADNPRPFNMIIVDMDNFKIMNDLYGHLFGDHILKTLALLLKAFSPDCYVGRIGGDEFLIIDYTSTDYDQLWNKLHVMLDTIRHTDFTKVEEKVLANVSQNYKLANFHASVTAGVVRFPIDGNDYDTLFMKADKALYRGKRKGRNCYIIYNDEKHKNINVERENDLDIVSSRDTLIYETLISNGLEELENSNSLNEAVYNFIKVFGEYLSIDRIVAYRHEEAFLDKLITCYANPNIPEASEKYVDKIVHESDDSRTMDLKLTYKRSNAERLKTLRPGIYEYIRKQNVKSFIQMPLVYEGTLYGFLRFDACQEIKNWKEEEEVLYKIMAKILSMYFYNYEQAFVNTSSNGKDNLTGLLDYKTAIEKLSHLLSDSTCEQVVIYANLNKFRFYNDNFGYQAGDNILRILSKVINDANAKLVARLTGDHFILLFDFVSLYDIKEKIERITNEFNKEIYSMLGKDEISVKFGVYITDGTETNPRACIDKARLALINIKSNQTSNYRIFDNEINLNYLAQKNILKVFNSDIKNNKFEVFLQPKIDAKHDKLIGAEALSRWKYEDTYLNPDAYIETLENYNLIALLDLYVFETVLKFMSNLKENNKELFPISVNLSKKQKEVSKYVDKLEVLRKKYDIDPKYLEIEVTETAFLNNYSDTMLAIKKLKEYGFIVDMDDFGTGYSNLNLLSKGVFDVIKFDKSLIQGIEDKNTSKILFHSIELAKSLGMSIVCEGVETSKQKELILANGGIVVQGFYYSKPLSIPDFIEKYLK